MASLTDISPAAILAGAECYDCALTPSQLRAVKTYLLCNFNRAVQPPCVTPSHPFQLRVSSRGTSDPNTELQLQWEQLPNGGGSFITGYIVFWGTTPGGPYTNNSGVIPASPKAYFATGLTAGTTYYFVVEAVAFTGCVSVVSAEANGTTAGAPPGNHLLSGLVSYWKVDGAAGLAGIQADSQDGNTTTLGGGVVDAVGGLFAGTGSLSSSGDARLNLNPCPANLKLGIGLSFTLQMWVRSNDFTTFRTLAGQYTGFQVTSSWILHNSGGGVRVVGYAPIGQYPLGPSAALVADNTTWNHVIVGYDSANKLLFLQVNGGARITVSTTVEDLNAQTTAWQMMADTTGDFFVGGLCQAAFWNRALSLTDVNNLYNAGAGLPFGSFTA